MASRVAYLVVLAAWIAALWFGLDFAARKKAPPQAIPTKQVAWPAFFEANILPSLPIADEFDTPLRPPNGAGAFVSFPFGEKGDLGESWTTAKGDAAKGEPVYSVADGWVSVAQDFQNAFGKVVFIYYRLPAVAGRWPPYVEVMYAEMDSIAVKAGDFVKRGQKIGTVGDGDDTYSIAKGGSGASLRWEVRQTVGTALLGPGYQANASGWLGPSDFITAHRGPLANVPLQVTVLNDANRAGYGSDY
jgi:murein DD-endopeptidase MepM/ murein hydrolase activator NlpD